MIPGLALILCCQLAGEAVARGLALPVPGPVVGLVLLLILLLLRDRSPAMAIGPLCNGRVETIAKGLLAHLSLMFVPAGVGVVQQLDLIAEHGLAIGLILVASVLITMLVTVGTFLLFSRLMSRGRAT